MEPRNKDVWTLSPVWMWILCAYTKLMALEQVKKISMMKQTIIDKQKGLKEWFAK